MTVTEIRPTAARAEDLEPYRRQETASKRTIKRAKAGDGRAFAEIYRIHASAIAAYLRGRRVADADGATNEVFLRAHRNLKRFHGEGDDLRAWLYTIARNLAIDDARSAVRRREVAVDALEVGHEAQVEAAEGSDDLRLLELLNDRQRDVILLRVVAGCSAAETARITGSTETAVRAAQHRGLARLERLLRRPEVRDEYSLPSRDEFLR